MVYMPTTNETGAGIRKWLADGEDVFIPRDILISSSDYITIYGAISNSYINVQGMLLSAIVPLRIGDDPSISNYNHVLVGRDGYIGTLGPSGAVEITGYNSRIENRGEISGIWNAITLSGSSDHSQSAIYNTGVISGELSAVLRSGSEDFLLRNRGEIVAREEYSAFEARGTSDDTIKNWGTMIGGIYLGEGNDRYDGRSGALFGVLKGGGGNDCLMAGAEDNQIHGGLGNDTITGGAGQDDFYFDTGLHSRRNVDRIIDFDPADDQLLLGNGVFSGLSEGRLAAGAFSIGTTGRALEADDRIIYETDTGRILFDADGLGGKGAQLFAIVSTDLALTARDFEIFSQMADFAKSGLEDSGWN